MKKIRPLFLLNLGLLFSFSTLAQVSFTADKTSGCPGDTITFTNTSTAGAGIAYFWEFGNGEDSTDLLGSANPPVVYQTPGVYDVTLAAFNLATQQLVGFAFEEVRIQGLSYASFEGGIGDSVCTLDEVEFYMEGSGDSVLWDFGDGNTSTEYEPTHQYAAANTYNVKLAFYSMCGIDSLDFNVTVSNDARPISNFYHAPDTVCFGEEVEFYTWSYHDNYSYSWNFDDGSTSMDPEETHLYANTGSYNVTHTVTNACGNSTSTSDTIVVSNTAPVNPYLDIFKIPFISSCPNDEVVFSVEGGSPNYSYLWNFGDGSTDTARNAKHTYTSTGNFDVSVVVTNACGNVDTLESFHTVDNNAQPMINQDMWGLATEDGDITTTAGCPGDSILFIVLAGNQTADFDFGDGNTGTATETFMDEDGFEIAIISHAYSSTGTYQVSLTITNGCGNSVSDIKTINIDNNHPADADFGIESPADDKDYYTCEPISFVAINGFSFFWNFGDGDTMTTSNTNIVHAYETAGDFNVYMVVTNGCGNIDTAWSEVEVIEITTPTISFQNDTISSHAPNADAYAWYKDGSLIPNETSDKLVPSSSGIYHLVITDANGCKAESDTLNVTLSLLDELRVDLQDVKLFPNPADNTINLSFYTGSTEAVEIGIHDITGQLIYTKMMNQSKGFKQIHLDIETLGMSNGLYLVKLSQSGYSTTRKLTVVK